jgi:hypothetical protein
MSRRWLLIVTSVVLCQTFISAATAQESTVHTLFGNWFGKKDDSSAQQDDRYNQRGSTNPSPHASARSQTNQVPPDPANGTPLLPGLGGSPLPKKGTQPATNNAIAKNGPTRQLNVSVPKPAPSVTPKSTNGGSTTSTATSSRQSPGHRSASHIGAGDLRNELSGSFTNGADTGEPVARTARAGETPGAVSVAPAAEKPSAPRENNLPTPVLGKSAASPLPSLPPRPVTRAMESEPHNAAEAFGATSEPQPSAGASRFLATPKSN